MILKEANLTALRDNKGVYFEFQGKDLSEDSISVPADFDGALGTIEFFKRYVVIHPANSESKKLSAEQFICTVESFGGEFHYGDPNE